jgi:hypothetical protein
VSGALGVSDVAFPWEVAVLSAYAANLLDEENEEGEEDARGVRA